MKRPLGFHYWAGSGDSLQSAAVLSMLSTWCFDLRGSAVEGMFIGRVLFFGAKFFEGRTIFTVCFDTLNSAKVSMKGPDDENIVWIGHRYGTRLEAETGAQNIESRLKESAVV